MKINSFTFQTTPCTDGQFAFVCPEIGICELPQGEESVGCRLLELTAECDFTLLLLYDAGELKETPILVHLLESMDIEETRHQLNQRRKDWAIVRNYPSLKDHWNLQVAIPSFDWDKPSGRFHSSKTEFKEALAEWNQTGKREAEAWEAFVCKGKDDTKWIEWIQWLTKKQLPGYVKSQQKEVWERWKNIGLPVLPFKEIIGK